MDANQIIDSIYGISKRLYKPEDIDRWPFQVGMLESKIRELVYQINEMQLTIDQLTDDLQKARNELSTMA